MTLYMTLRIATLHQVVRLTINLTKTRKPQSPRIQILLKIQNSAAASSAARETIDFAVADMYLSLVK